MKNNAVPQSPQEHITPSLAKVEKMEDVKIPLPDFLNKSHADNLNVNQVLNETHLAEWPENVVTGSLTGNNLNAAQAIGVKQAGEHAGIRKDVRQELAALNTEAEYADEVPRLVIPRVNRAVKNTLSSEIKQLSGEQPVLSKDETEAKKQELIKEILASRQDGKLDMDEGKSPSGPGMQSEVIKASDRVNIRDRFLKRGDATAPLATAPAGEEKKSGGLSR